MCTHTCMGIVCISIQVCRYICFWYSCIHICMYVLIHVWRYSIHVYKYGNMYIYLVYMHPSIKIRVFWLLRLDRFGHVRMHTYMYVCIHTNMEIVCVSVQVWRYMCLPVEFRVFWLRLLWVCKLLQQFAQISMYVDCGSSVIVKHSFVRKLSNV